MIFIKFDFFIYLLINVLISVHNIGKHLGARIIKTLPIVSG